MEFIFHKLIQEMGLFLMFLLVQDSLGVYQWNPAKVGLFYFNNKNQIKSTSIT
jgi:hypothetical protein